MRCIGFFLIFTIFLSHAFFYFQSLGGDAVDDAYISFRYSKNLADGRGLVYNTGERVEGYSNFGWMLAMVPVIKAKLPVGQVAMVLGLMASGLTVYLAFNFVLRKTGLEILAWGTALFLVVDGSFVLWSVSGMETGLFTLFIFLGSINYIYQHEKNTGINWGLIFGLASLVRFEGMAFMAATLGHALLWKMIFRKEENGKAVIGNLMGYGLIFGSYWLVRFWYYGYPFPNTFYAKINLAHPWMEIQRGLGYLGQFMGGHLGILIIGVIGYGLYKIIRRLNKKKDREIFFWQSYFLTLIGVTLVYIVFVGGDWSVGRFFVPILPRMYILTTVGLWSVWQRLLKEKAERVVSFLFVLILIAITLFWSSSWEGEYRNFIIKENAGEISKARVEMGRYLANKLERDVLIAADAAGQIPYFSELPTIDMYGMNDLHIGHLTFSQTGTGLPGHEKFDLDYVTSRKPDYMVVTGNPGWKLNNYNVVDLNWTTNEERKKLITIYKRI